MGGHDSDGLHWEGDGDLTFEQRAALVRLDPDLAPVPVIEEQPPAKQNGRAQLRVALYFAALAAYVVTLYLLATLGGRA